jgi:SOS-response transcriptional repressor LexA
MSNPPTKRQLDILRFIARYSAEHHYAPSLRDICDELGTTGTNGVAEHLERLEKKGLIGRAPKVPRGLWLTDAGRDVVGSYD